MVNVSRLLARLLGAMLLVVAVASPAMTVDAHAAAHRVSSIDATEHHHHDEHGAVIAADHHDHDPQAPYEGDDGGHEHMQAAQVLFDVAQAPPTFRILVSGSAMEKTIGSDRPRPDIALPPPSRPPRFI